MGKAHKKEASSAGISCVAAAIPFPSVKAKQLGVMTASFGAGAAALIADVGKQYRRYDSLNTELSFLEKLKQINWSQSFREAGAQSLIAGISAGVTVYAASHPKFINFSEKVKKLSYEQIEKVLKKSGFSGKTADDFCRWFGVRKALVAAGGYSRSLAGILKNTYDGLVRAGYKVIDDGSSIIFKNVKDLPIAKISGDALHIKIPYDNGWATQSTNQLSKQVYTSVAKERKVYRIGRLSKSQAGEAQFWSPESPYSYKSIWEYASKYGIPEANLKGEGVFFEVGIIPENVPFITREAPCVQSNLGGAIEVVTLEKSIKLESFSTVKFD